MIDDLRLHIALHGFTWPWLRPEDQCKQSRAHVTVKECVKMETQRRPRSATAAGGSLAGWRKGMSLRPDASGSDPLGSRALFIGRQFCQLHLRGMLRLRLWRCQGLQSVLAPAARHREQRLHGVEAENGLWFDQKRCGKWAVFDAGCGWHLEVHG